MLSSKVSKITIGASLTVCFGLGLAGCGNGSTGDEESGGEYQISYATPTGPQAGVQQQLEELMDLVTEHSDGRVEWSVNYSGALLDTTDIAAGVGQGRADAAFFATPYDPGLFPLFNLGYLPIENVNPIGAALAWDEMFETNTLLQEEMEAANLKIVGLQGVSNANTIATDTRLETLSDIHGSEIRFIGPVAQALADAGASPVAMGAEDVYSAMETGVIDGIGIFTMDALVGEGLHEVAPWSHHLRLGYTGSSQAMIMNLDYWNSLPEDIQAAFESAREEYYEGLGDMLAEMEELACDTLLENNGGAVYFPSAEDEGDKWRDDAVDTLMEKWRSEAVNAGHSEEDVRAFEEEFTTLAEEYSTQSEYVDGRERCVERTDG